MPQSTDQSLSILSFRETGWPLRTFVVWTHSNSHILLTDLNNGVHNLLSKSCQGKLAPNQVHRLYQCPVPDCTFNQYLHLRSKHVHCLQGPFSHEHCPCSMTSWHFMKGALTTSIFTRGPRFLHRRRPPRQSTNFEFLQSFFFPFDIHLNLFLSRTQAVSFHLCALSITRTRA